MLNGLEEKMAKCPVCERDAIQRRRPSDFDNMRFEIECKVCGTFLIDHEHRVFGLDQPEARRRAHELSGFIRERSESGQILHITSLDPDKIDELLSGNVPTTVQEKMDRLLQRMAMPQRSEYPGAKFPIDSDNDYPLAYARNRTELLFFLEHLKDSGLAQRDSSAGQYWLTTKGWERVDNLKESRATSTEAFVAMHFTAALEDLYDKGIKPGIEEAGYNPVRVDRKDYIGKADDYIIAQIKQSRFMVADMTDQRQSVYFEAGYAMGLGLQVVWLCKDDDVDNLHFDIRQYNHLLWKRGDWEDLKDKLRYRIEATIGGGPVKPGS